MSGVRKDEMKATVSGGSSGKPFERRQDAQICGKARVIKDPLQRIRSFRKQHDPSALIPLVRVCAGRWNCTLRLLQFADDQRIEARGQRLCMLSIFVYRGEAVIFANFEVDLARPWRKDMNSNYACLLRLEPVNKLAINCQFWTLKTQGKARVAEELPVIHHRQYNGNQPNGAPPG